MADKNYVAITAQYESEDEAVADFDALTERYKDDGRHQSFDAAVVVRDAEGNVSIPKRDNEIKSHGGRTGLAVGIAGGIVVALFPAVALGGALLAGAGVGGGIGALAGHISNKSSEKDLKKMSETLRAGSAGIVVVVSPEQADEVQQQLAHATAVSRAAIAVDDEKLDDEVKKAE